MPENWNFQVAAYFTDSRPVRDVKYDIEKRVKRLLHRDPERSETLVFRGTQQEYHDRRLPQRN